MNETPSDSKAKKPRRTRGEGGIYQRTRIRRGLEVEVWVGQVEAGVDPKTGRRLRRFVYGDTKTAVREKIEELRGKQRLHVDLRAGIETLRSFVETWLAEKEANGMKASALADYKDLLGRLVLPHLGGVKLEALDPLRIRRWHHQLRHRFEEKVREEKKRREALRVSGGVVPTRPIDTGARTVQKAHAVLRAVLADAARLRVIPFNPAHREAAQSPAYTTPKRRALEPAQARALLEAAAGHELEAFVLLGLLHGLRYGEAAGLRWQDVDLRAGVLRIEHTLAEENRTGKRTLTSPKTKASKRTIPLSARARAALAELRKKIGAEPHPGRFVFTDGNGQPLRRSNFHRRVWKPLCTAARLPEGVHFHDLRHTCGSLLLDEGVPLPEVSRLLGHANPQITLRVYSHALEASQQTTATTMDALFG